MYGATLLIGLCRISIEFMLLLICQSSLLWSGQFTATGRQKEDDAKRLDNTLQDLHNSLYPTQPHSLMANYACAFSQSETEKYFQ